MDIFSLSLGAGATGLLLKPTLSESVLPWAALLGALIFSFAIVKPIIGWLAKFASTPSDGIEGLISQSGTALTRFDDQGRGLVCLTLDGAGIQILATLDRDEWSRGVLVAKGDPVTILEVDATKNTCRVTRELAA